MKDILLFVSCAFAIGGLALLLALGAGTTFLKDSSTVGVIRALLTVAVFFLAGIYLAVISYVRGGR